MQFRAGRLCDIHPPMIMSFSGRRCCLQVEDVSSGLVFVIRAAASVRKNPYQKGVGVGWLS